MPPSPRGLARRRGFALLVVVWGLGLVMLLAVSYMTTARPRLQAAFNAAGAARAALVADGAIDLAILELLAEQTVEASRGDAAARDGAPRFCALAGAAVAFVLEDEGGKVDLNAASPTLLQALLVGFGVDMRDADSLARAIVAFRTTPTNAVAAVSEADRDAGRPFEPKRAPFQTTLELDQIVGMEPSLLRLLLPVVTVHSQGGGVDPRSAPPSLFAALAGYAAGDVMALAATPYPNGLDRRDPRFPIAFRQGGFRAGAFLVHVEVALPGGHVGVEEALVLLRSVGAEPYSILERRGGEARYKERLRAVDPAAAPRC